jgi:hypothetical protein
MVGYVALVSRRVATRGLNFLSGFPCRLCLDIKNIHMRATGRKKQCDRSADAARAPGNDRGLAVEAKPIRIVDGIFQTTTPAFRRIKSNERESPFPPGWVAVRLDRPVLNYFSRRLHGCYSALNSSGVRIILVQSHACLEQRRSPRSPLEWRQAI